MSCCNHCRDAGILFNDRTSQKELKRYRKKGPGKLTRLMLNTIHQENPEGKSLLDIGGGIGAISFELFKDGLLKSLQVDASEAYIATAREEAKKRGLTGKMQLKFGDFAELADQVEPADVVTLDRVVCCYPDMEKLVDSSAQKAVRLYGITYPKNRWHVRVGISLANLYMRFRKSDFRVYMHPPQEIDRKVRSHGFTLKNTSQTWNWQAAVYERN